MTTLGPELRLHADPWVGESSAVTKALGENEGSAHVGKGPLYPQHPLPLLTVSFLEGSAWSVSFLGA